MLNPTWLRSFAAVAERGGFTRAANLLGLTQAAISQHMRHLEDRLGPLLIRQGRQIELTPTGQTLLLYCQEVEQADQRLQARLSDATVEHGEVSLITPGSVGLALYPALLQLQQVHRGLAIRHRFAPDTDILQAVLNKQFELGLLTLRPNDPRLIATPFAEEALELVMPASARATTWSALAELGFIDHPDGQAMATRLLAREFPGNTGMRSLPIRGFTNQIALILEPVARGLGFTVIPSHARQAFHQPDAITVWPSRTPVIDTLWLIHRAEWPLSARATWVVRYLSEHCCHQASTQQKSPTGQDQ